ncbi:MAG: helix-turn-helix transcriptional regulator [Oscillospiraceae bacterium]
MNFREHLAQQLKNEEFRKEYESLSARRQLVELLIRERNAQNLTQQDLATRVGMKASNISRLESGNYNPSLDLLEKVAGGLGKKIHVTMD